MIFPMAGPPGNTGLTRRHEIRTGHPVVSRRRPNNEPSGEAGGPVAQRQTHWSEFSNMGRAPEVRPALRQIAVVWLESMQSLESGRPLVETMCIGRLVLFLVLTVGPVKAQLVTQNPLDQLKEQLATILAEAGVPFTPIQEGQVALLVEEQRQASENLFGDIMDFSNGIPEGAERDRALASIQWIHDAFRAKLPDYLTTDQRAVVEAFESRGGTLAATIDGAEEAGAEASQIQQIRVTNNTFNVENGRAGFNGPQGGQRTEVIERGGSGAYHGNFSAEFEDDALNARNPTADNKPQSRERTISGNISGPLIRDRLTASFSMDNNRRENVGSVVARTLDGPFTLGITRPRVMKTYEGRGIFRLSEANSFHFGVQYDSESEENEGIGGFTLPERGANSFERSIGFDVRQISVFSENTVHETSFSWRGDREETIPITAGQAINVLDAFNSGGGQNRSELDGTSMHFRNLLYFEGNRLTVRAGSHVGYWGETSIQQNNVEGLFTFSDLESFGNGQPQQYDVNVGDPLVEQTHIETELFLQNDFRLTNRLTLNFGLRYSTQNNLDDRNDFDPRVGFAYAVGNSTVLRGGSGIFHQRLGYREFRRVLQEDGTRQHRIRISDPGWPAPYLAADVEAIPPPSRRVLAPDFLSGYYFSSLISVEQSLPANLFVAVSFDYNRGTKMRRMRNINAPLPGTLSDEHLDGIRPFPEEGDVLQLESSGLSIHKNFRVRMRQRFSIFNVNADYTGNLGHSDGNGSRVPADSYNLRGDWGRAGLQRTHRFNASVNSRLPWDVYLTTTVNFTSGDMYSITTGRDDNRDGEFTDRPAVASDLTRPGVVITDFGAFDPHPIPGQAIITRNSETGPNFRSWGFNLSKAFQLAGNSRVSIFANLSNAFNMTNLGTPSGTLTSRNFGLSTSASSPRRVQAGMRYQF